MAANPHLAQLYMLPIVLDWSTQHEAVLIITEEWMCVILGFIGIGFH